MLYIIIIIILSIIATLKKFIKDTSSSIGLKTDKTSVDLIDKLTVKFISYISKEASNVCLDSGKKTITVTHVVEGMKKIGLEKHIKQLYTELDPKSLLEEEDIKENIPTDMKAKINGRKRKTKDKKHKKIEMTEDMINEQSILFQKSRQEAYEIMIKENMENLGNRLNANNYNNNNNFCDNNIYENKNNYKAFGNDSNLINIESNNLELCNNEEENYDD